MSLAYAFVSPSCVKSVISFTVPGVAPSGTPLAVPAAAAAASKRSAARLSC